jgi:hypothetical protein
MTSKFLHVLVAGLALSLALPLTSCRQTESEFTDQTGDNFDQDADFDEDAVTVGDDADRSADVVVAPDSGVSLDEVWTPPSGDFVMRDEQTGSLWNMRGEAFEGPLAGQKLEQVPAFNAFWFAWSTFYHGGEIWNKDIDNTPGDIEPSDGCEVPCDEIRLGCSGGKDCIPKLDHDGTGEMVAADGPGTDYLSNSSFILGTVIDGQARAYPHNILWWHEIFNDEVNGTQYSVTFCPLTGSGLVFPGRRGGQEVTYGVSGRLYNANLVMYDAPTDTFWSQMLLEGVTGELQGERLELMPVVETTWGRWKQMHPDTRVISSDTGHSRDYNQYPYGDYRTDDSNTFQAVNPAFQETYEAKDRVLSLVGGPETSKAYAFPEIEAIGDRVVINDTFDDQPVVIAYQAEHRLAVPFRARVNGQRLTFEGASAP